MSAWTTSGAAGTSPFRIGAVAEYDVTVVPRAYGERRWEFDVLAVNGDEVVVVEVKTTLKVADVDYFVERLHDFPN